MDIVHDGLTVCHECACYLANGEGSPDHDVTFTEGMQQWDGYDVVLACPDDESACEGFTWQPCSICGQRGGSVHPAVTFRREDVAYVSRPGDGQVRVVGADSTVYVGNAAPSIA